MPRKTGCQYPYNSELDEKRLLISKMPNPLAIPHHPYEIDDQHPSLYAAIEELMIYERWVSRVVLPIAFRWIDENKEEVYAGIKYEYKDDIGVVINAAFNAVMKKTPIEGDHKTRAFNPTWVEMIRSLEEARSAVLTTEGNPVDGTAYIPTDEQVPA